MFKTAASAGWATRAHTPGRLRTCTKQRLRLPPLPIGLQGRGASGGQRSRNLRDVNAALCRLSYAGLVGSGGFELPSPVYQTGALNRCATIRRVGPQRFELWSACYKQAALTVELRADEIGGPERIRTSTATRRFYRALGSLMPSRPVGAATGTRTLTACLEGRYACPLRHSSRSGPASRLRTYNLLIKSQLLWPVEL